MLGFMDGGRGPGLPLSLLEPAGGGLLLGGGEEEGADEEEEG